MRRLYERMIAPTGMRVHIASELGRYMTGPHGCLVSTAIHEKHIYKEYIGLDACAANLMRPAMYGAYHHITVAGKEDLPCDHIYDIVGSLCENNDKFAVDRPLPHIDNWRSGGHPRYRRARPFHGLQLQRQAAIRRSSPA